MPDIEFPLTEEILNKNIQKMLYLPDSSKVLIWYNNKSFDIDVDLSDSTKTTENYWEIIDQKLNGKADTATKESILHVMSSGLQPYYEEYVNSQSADKDKVKQSKIILAFETVKEQARNLFTDEYQIAHIAIPIEGHLEILPINSSAFKNWYRMFIFERNGIVLDTATVNDTCSLASAYAASHKYGSQIPLNLRTALKYDFRTQWVYDLVNKDWEFIKINSSGWEIFKDEIIFRRYSNQKSQVYPDRNYESNVLNQLMTLVNTKNKDSILLLKCYIISLFIPEIQKVILILHGSQGAAKSSLQELIRMLVDPSVIMTLTFPRDVTELIQQLSHNYIAYYDNVSRISPLISDQLCRAVTGSGASKRQLYTDDDDKIYNYKRCIGMNGINIAATKEDLLDRSIIISLDDIDDKDRLIPSELWSKFNSLKPQLLGYIFDILVKVMQYEEINHEAVEKLKLSRMTEFVKYGEIISRCMGNEDNALIDAYNRNKEIQVEEIIEFSQVATAIMCMMFKKYPKLKQWDGTPTELYGEIREIAENLVWELNIDTNERYWPRSPKALGRRINEIKPTLKAKGLQIIRYEESDQQKTRKIKIVRTIMSETSETSEDDKSRSKLAKFSDNSDNLDDILHTSMGDVSKLIKLHGTPRSDGDGLNYEVRKGALTLQNNFLTGQVKMQGNEGGAYPTNYLALIDTIFGPEPNTIEVCSKTVHGGCFTVDINPEHKPDLVVDGQTLEGIRDNTFSRWRCDPPYNAKTAKEMYNTKFPSLYKLLAEGARLVKPNSLLFLLHSSHGPSKIAELVRIGYITISVVPNNKTRILNIYVKLPEEKT